MMEVVKFTVLPKMAGLDIELLYLWDQYSFFCKDHPKGPGVSINVNEVEMWLNEGGQILYVDGFCPYQEWKETCRNVPPFVRAGLAVTNPTPCHIPRGIAIAMNDRVNPWSVSINPEGWVCIGDTAASGDTAIEFARDCVAVLEEQNLLALWLRPRIVGRV